MKKLVKTVILIAVLAIMALSYTVSAEELLTAECMEPGYIPGSIYNPDRVEIRLFSDNGWNISPNDKETLYKLIESNLNSRAESFNVEAFRIPVKYNSNGEVVGVADEFLNLYCSVVYNNPQSGYLITGFEFGYYNSWGLVAYIVPYYMAESEYDAEAYQFAADYALSMTVSPDMTDVEKLLSIHDYLTDNIKYNKTNGDRCYSPYGALVDGIAVCQGYSLAYKLLCDRAGLNVSYVVDDPHNHIWNVAELDGKYYHIDVTWDDPVFVNDEDRSLHQTRHDFFLLSDDTNYEIREFTERTWVNYFGDCTDDSYENSVYSIFGIPLVWKDGAFWGREVKHVDDENGDRFEYNGVLYKISGGKFTEVTADKFAPFDELEYTFGYVADGVLAIKGKPNSNAMLYSATFNDDGSFEGVKNSILSFDSQGKCVIRGVVGNKQLLWGSGQKPVAYARDN